MGTPNSFSVETPAGTIRVVESPDKDNPGIVVMFMGKEEKELMSCSMQYMEATKQVKACIWGKDNPDGEPAASCHADAHIIEIEMEGAEGPVRTAYTVSEFEIAVRDGRVNLSNRLLGAWMDGAKMIASTVVDVAEILEQICDFTY